MALGRRVIWRRIERGQEEDASTEGGEERPDPKVASACHQLGLVAQAQGHSDAAQSWHIEALKAGVRLKDFGLCARNAHQLARVCQRLGRRDEAAAWSALHLASLSVSRRRAERPSAHKRKTLAGRVEFVTVESTWRSATGGNLPVRMKRALEGWLDDASAHPTSGGGSGAANGPGSGG